MRFSGLKVCAAVLLFVVMGSTYGATFDRSAEVKKYLAEIESGNQPRTIDACKAILNSGITDKKLFDVINKKILDVYKSVAREDRLGLDYTAWLLRALGSSGIEGYRTTFEEVLTGTPHKKLRNYAKNQLDDLSWYKQRNALMASMENHKKDRDPNISRLINLLKADDLAIQGYAANRVSDERISEAYVYDIIEQELLRIYDNPKQDKQRVETIGWFSKVLGLSGKKKYEETLQKVVASPVVHPKAKKHAQLALTRLY